MKAIWNWVLSEPPRVIAIVIAVANMAFGLTEGQEELVQNIVESFIVLVGGEAARANVTPTKKE